jgi:ABC-type transporter Mla MlaB component
VTGAEVLKITNLERAAEQELKVEGKLSEPWVSELESAWNRVRQEGRSGQIVVNLSDMTYVDPKGKAVLMAMVAEGARLTAKGIYCEYVVDQLLKETQKARARRHRRKRAGASQSGATSESRQGIESSPIKETQ